MLLLKAIARLVETLLMVVLALVAIGIGLVALDQLISIGSASPPRLLHLPVVRRHVGHFLTQTATPGAVALVALLGGIGAVLLGLILLWGILGSRRERVLVIDTDGDGGTYARPRIVSRMARSEVERAKGVTSVRRPRVALRRSGRSGRLRIRAARGPEPDLKTVDEAVHARIDAFADSLHLKPDVRVRLDEPEHARVEET